MSRDVGGEIHDDAQTWRERAMTSVGSAGTAWLVFVCGAGLHVWLECSHHGNGACLRRVVWPV